MHIHYGSDLTSVTIFTCADILQESCGFPKEDTARNFRCNYRYAAHLENTYCLLFDSILPFCVNIFTLTVTEAENKDGSPSAVTKRVSSQMKSLQDTLEEVLKSDFDNKKQWEEIGSGSFVGGNRYCIASVSAYSCFENNYPLESAIVHLEERQL